MTLNDPVSTTKPRRCLFRGLTWPLTARSARHLCETQRSISLLKALHLPGLIHWQRVTVLSRFGLAASWKAAPFPDHVGAGVLLMAFHQERHFGPTRLCGPLGWAPTGQLVHGPSYPRSHGSDAGLWAAVAHRGSGPTEISPASRQFQDPAGWPQARQQHKFVSLVAA